MTCFITKKKKKRQEEEEEEKKKMFVSNFLCVLIFVLDFLLFWKVCVCLFVFRLKKGKGRKKQTKTDKREKPRNTMLIMTSGERPIHSDESREVSPLLLPLPSLQYGVADKTRRRDL